MNDHDLLTRCAWLNVPKWWPLTSNFLVLWCNPPPRLIASSKAGSNFSELKCWSKHARRTPLTAACAFTYWCRNGCQNSPDHTRSGNRERGRCRSHWRRDLGRSRRCLEQKKQERQLPVTPFLLHGGLLAGCNFFVCADNHYTLYYNYIYYNIFIRSTELLVLTLRSACMVYAYMTTIHSMDYGTELLCIYGNQSCMVVTTTVLYYCANPCMVYRPSTVAIATFQENVYRKSWFWFRV